MFPEGEGSQQEQEGKFEQIAQYEMSTAYRRAELTEFAEQLRPQDVRHYSAELVGAWLRDWFVTGESPNEYLTKNTRLSAKGRLEQLRDSMPNGNYVYTPQEQQAGLVEGTYWTLASPDLILADDVEVRAVKRPDGSSYEAWFVDGKEVGLFKTDKLVGDILGDGNYRPRIYVGSRVTRKEASAKREELAEAVEERLPIIESWDNLMKKVSEQDTFSGDLDNYIKKFFRVGKALARSRFYHEILNSPPTREGFARFGDKVVLAHEAWRDLADGRAIVEMDLKESTEENPYNARREKLVIPNPFAYPRNQGLMELCVKYVQSRVEQQAASTENKTDTLKYAENKDNMNAAIAALVLMDHWDEDAEAAMDIVWDEGYISDINFEIAFVDSAKLIYPTERRRKEFLGYTVKEGERRPHPREAGAPITLEFLPKLSSHLLDVVSVNTIATNKQTGEKEVISVTVDQIAYGAKDKNDKRVIETDSEVDKKYSYVRIAKNSSDQSDSNIWKYEVIGLQDQRIWDSIQIVLGEGKATKAYTPEEIINMIPLDPRTQESESIIKDGKKKMEIALGTSTNAYEIPKSLMEVYALIGIYNEFTRTDYIKQYKDYTEGDYSTLKSLNKKISSACGLLQRAHQLSDDTVEDLEEFIRVGLVAGLAASLVARGRSNPTGSLQEQQSQVAPEQSYEKDAVAKKMKRALFATRFVITKSNNNGEHGWERGKDRKLFNEILARRDQAPLNPFDLNYFTDAQKQELKPLYPYI